MPGEHSTKRRRLTFVGNDRGRSAASHLTTTLTLSAVCSRHEAEAYFRMKLMKRLKLAVVGVGALGRHHARILAELDTVELVAVAETNAQTGQEIAEAHGTEWTSDYHDLFDRIDGVSIAVPTRFHLTVATEFLKRGIPTLVEKPLAATLDEAQQLVQLADDQNTLLQVGHVEQFNPAMRVAARLCGSPKYIRAERLSPYAFRSTDIGVVHDLMIHDLDLVLDLVDSPVRDVQALGLSILGGHEDCVQARLTFENGCIADLTSNRVNPAAKRSLLIWSDLGTVSADLMSREVVSYSASETLRYGTPILERAAQPDADIEQLKRDMFGKFLKVEQPSVPPADALTDELADFVECIQQGRRPIVDGHRALAAMRVADRVLECVAGHQWDGHADGPVGPFAQVRHHRKLAG